MSELQEAGDFANGIIMGVDDNTDIVESKFARIDNRFAEMLEEIKDNKDKEKDKEFEDFDFELD